ncbi:MAG: GEVED domain-containing protein [Pirellula sp.]
MFRSKRPTKLSLQFEKLENRWLFAASPVQWQGIGYFPGTDSPSIHRYDIAHERWLSPITLQSATSGPDALHVDSDGIYAAFDKTVYRYNLAGSSRRHLFNASTNVIAIHSDANLLFVNNSIPAYARITSINKSTNTVIDTMDSYVWALGGSSIAASKNRLLGRSIGVGWDLTYVDYSNAGKLIRNGDTHYHGEFEGALRVWVFGDERYVVDDSGHIYATDSLVHSGRLGNKITDVDFLAGSVPIVLNGKTLTAYSNAFVPTGTLELSSPGDEIFVNARNVLVFREQTSLASGYSVEAVGLNLLGSPQASPTVNPVGLAYTPDEEFVAKDGTLLLFSQEHQSIFRWDPVSEKYSQSIRLVGSPVYVAYSQSLNVLYACYADGLIRKLDLNNPNLEELPFFKLPKEPLGLIAADDYLIAEDSSGAWSTLYSLDKTGRVVQSRDWHYPTSGLIWDSKNQSLYYLSMYSPSDLHSIKINANGSDKTIVAGGIGDFRESPLHGSTLIELPVRISPDGNRAVLGSGGVFNAKSLEPLPQALSNTALDFAWLGSELFSLRNIAGVSQVQRWIGNTYVEAGIRQFSQHSERLIAIRSNVLLLIGSSSDGVPTFHLLNSKLEDVNIQGIVPATPNITWNPPREMLAINPLGTDILSATADVPGSFVYSPSLGTRLSAGEQEIVATFTPTDTKAYVSVTRSIRIRVLGMDLGDAPSRSLTGPGNAYAVTLAQNGARHILRDTLRLGASVDAEQDGSPSDSNLGGDNATGKDEDGVEFPATILSLAESSSSSLSAVTNGNGYVTAWIDFDGDGFWSSGTEHVVRDQWVTAGKSVFSFDVPSNVPVGKIAARIRFSSQPGLTPVGLAENGEVEDYLIEVRDVGQPIDVTPVGSGTVSIVDRPPAHIAYIEDGIVLARYPKSIWNIMTVYCDGTAYDETIDLSSSNEGELFLLGDGRAGKDRIVFKAKQNLDLTKQFADSIRNIEVLDLRNQGANRLRLDQASVLLATDSSRTLRVYAEAVDEVLMRGNWRVDTRIELDGTLYHHLKSDSASVLLQNSKRHQNPINRFDVDLDNGTSPLDVLSVINLINHGVGRSPEDSGEMGYSDVDGDGSLSPLDVLAIINHLNDRA